MGEEQEESLFVNGAAFSPDSTRILVASKEGARLWETASGKLVSTFEESYRFLPHIEVAFSADGNTVIIGFFDGTSGLWEATSGKLLARLERHSSWINCVTFSPDNRLAVTCDGHGRVHFYYTSGSERGRLVGLYTATYEIAAIHWHDAHHMVLVDQGGPHGSPHFYQLKIEGF